MTIDWDWTRVVFDHVKIGVRDLEASVGFYGAVLQTHSSDAGGRYYAAFVLDPDGNNVEAVLREF